MSQMSMAPFSLQSLMTVTEICAAKKSFEFEIYPFFVAEAIPSATAIVIVMYHIHGSVAIPADVD